MKSTFATELFVKLFGIMPPKKGDQISQRNGLRSEVMIPNRASKPGEKVIYHVVPRHKDERWNIQKEGGSRPSAVCDTKEEALNRAREIAHNQGWSQVIIHNRDGKIAHDFSYGSSPTNSEPATHKPRKSAISELASDEDDFPDDTESDDGFIDDYDGDEVDDEDAFQALAGQRVIYHVTPRKSDGRWNVRRRGADRPSAVIENKGPAFERAREFARKHPWSQVIIHNQNGKIANEYVYGGPPQEDPGPEVANKANGARVVYHVTPRTEDGKWRVTRVGSQRPTRVLDRKVDAVQAAKELARNKPSGQVIIHRKDGQISEEFKYGGS